MFLIRVKSNRPCWISPWEGDPGRTLRKEYAKVYKRKPCSELDRLKKEYPNRSFSIEKQLNAKGLIGLGVLREGDKLV